MPEQFWLLRLCTTNRTEEPKKETIHIATAEPGLCVVPLVGHSNQKLWWATAMFAILSIQGCGTVKGVVIPIMSQYCDPAAVNCFVRRNKPVQILVSGIGKCSLVRLKFGDGEFIEGSNIDFGKAGSTKDWEVTHTYQGWPGMKLVKVEGVTNCVGSGLWLAIVYQPTDIPNTFETDVKVGFAQPTPTACTPVPNVPLLRKNTKVKITTGPTVINFGCPLNSCIHDADGKPNSIGFVFPQMRAFSLVLRVGTQVVQGGTNMSFTTNQSGPLELCVNDHDLANNGGAWGVFITVDERLAP